MENLEIINMLKKTVKICFRICIVLDIIMIVYSLTKFIPNIEYLKYATVNGGSSIYYDLEVSGNTAYSALQGIVIGVIMIPCYLIGYYLLLSVALFTESNIKIVNQNEELLQIIKSKINED